LKTVFCEPKGWGGGEGGDERERERERENTQDKGKPRVSANTLGFRTKDSGTVGAPTY
jgi:hypothetical protein